MINDEFAQGSFIFIPKYVDIRGETQRNYVRCEALTQHTRVLRGSYAAYEGLARLLRSATRVLRGSYAAIRRYNTRVTRRISLVCTGHTRLLRGSYEAYGVHANFIHVFTQGAAYLGKFANTQGACVYTHSVTIA